jgi:hypothetical protein
VGVELYIACDDAFAFPAARDPQSYLYDEKPGLNRAFLRGLILCLPVASAIWAGIIYSASRLAR